MEPIDSKCFHVGGGITTATVGTQSSGNCTNSNNNGNSGCVSNNNGNNGNNGTNSGELTLAKSKAQLNSGNYINIVPMPMGVQYHHRRKYSPQIQSDYQ